jgi:peptidoglycan/LPS O-acetylase OafA/YrhL
VKKPDEMAVSDASDDRLACIGLGAMTVVVLTVAFIPISGSQSFWGGILYLTTIVVALLVGAGVGAGVYKLFDPKKAVNNSPSNAAK